MAAVRSSKPAAADGPLKLRRTKVLTTAMDDVKPAAKKRIVKGKVSKAKVPKAKAATVIVAKAKVSKAKIPKAKSSRPRMLRPKPTDPEPVETAPNEPTPWLSPREARPPRRSAIDRIDDPPPATGLELITRVTSAIERELNQIEVIVGGHRIRPSERTEGERRARTLASLARTLSEVARLRAQHQQKADDDDDDSVPRDLDELRETLARRLEKLLADPTQPSDCEPEPG